MQEPEPIHPEDWPSVDLAYEFVRPAYETLGKRIDSIEAAVRAVLTFAATVSFAVPAFVTATLGSGRRDFTSPWFLLAMVLFLASAIVGLASVLSGDIRIVDPATLYNEWLGLSPFEFKRRAVWVAGQDLQANARRVDRLAATVRWMAAGLLAESACLLVWITGF